MQKILMIVNPKAGKAKSKKYIENILINLKNSRIWCWNRVY